MTIEIDENTRLELTAERHAHLLFEAINNNREHLSEFLPWVSNMQTLENTRAYIDNCKSLYKEKKEVSFVIVSDHDIIGRIGLHHWDQLNKNAAIGYWLTKKAVGKGVIYKCCQSLISYGFEKMNLQRIEIKAAVKNLRSQAIPTRLGFKKEGILRKAERVNGEFLDLILFSLLEEEWIAESKK